MANVGRFFNRKGEGILYRSILPPLSKNFTTADRIVLTFSNDRSLSLAPHRNAEHKYSAIPSKYSRFATDCGHVHRGSFRP